MRSILLAILTVGLASPLAMAQTQTGDRQLQSLRAELAELRTQLLEIQKQLAELKTTNQKQTETLETSGQSEKMKQWLDARSRMQTEQSALKQQRLQVKRSEEGLKRTVAHESQKMEAKQAAADQAAAAAKTPPTLHAAPQKITHARRNRVRSYPYPYYSTNGVYHGKVIYGPHGYYPYPYYRPYPRVIRHTGPAATVNYKDDNWSFKLRF